MKFFENDWCVLEWTSWVEFDLKKPESLPETLIMCAL